MGIISAIPDENTEQPEGKTKKKSTPPFIQKQEIPEMLQVINVMNILILIPKIKQPVKYGSQKMPT